MVENRQGAVDKRSQLGGGGTKLIRKVRLEQLPLKEHNQCRLIITGKTGQGGLLTVSSLFDRDL